MNYPDFNVNHNSLMRKHLSKDIFNKLRDQKTSKDYTLLQAINSGIVNPDSHIGIYAGDYESYQVFADIFDPIIEDYHGFTKLDLHKSDMDIDKLDISNPDPQGEYILSTRIRVGRNLKNRSLGSSISNKERKNITTTIQNALTNLNGDFSGNYYALNNMSKILKEELINDHFLFKQGDRFLEAAGINRDWPNDRGIYFNNKKNFLVWVNEEDALRIISMEKGADLKTVFHRLVRALNQLTNELEFEYCHRLGYISSCPTNLGTAMRASVHIKLPQLALHKDILESITNKHHLQIRGIHGEHSQNVNATFDISNRRRLGITEVEAIKDLYHGIIHLIEVEKSYAAK